MKNKIRWGILGTGTIAYQFARGLKLVPEAILYAVGSRTISKAEVFSKEFGADCFYGSYADLVAEPNIDVVYIATPHNYHKEHCILCLEANKPVLCEKPFTSNAEEAETVIRLAREKGLFCMEAMWMRFIPLMKEVRRLIQEKYIGEVCLLQASLGYPFVFDESHRMFDVALDANVVIDLGIYPISLAFYLLGTPTDVYSYSNTGKTGIDDQGTIILKYPQHLAALSCSYRTKASNDAVIAGTGGQIHIRQPLLNPHSMAISKFSPQIAETGSASSKLKAFAKDIPGANSLFNLIQSVLRPSSKTINMPFRGTGIQYEIEEVVNCLKQGELESSIMPLDESLEIIKLINKIRH
jgi:predicted dehydrogenase